MDFCSKIIGFLRNGNISRGKSVLELWGIYHFSSRLTATLNLCLIYFKITLALAILLEHMRKKFEINRTKIKSGSQSGRKVVTHNSKSNLPLIRNIFKTNVTQLFIFLIFCVLEQHVPEYVLALLVWEP